MTGIVHIVFNFSAHSLVIYRLSNSGDYQSGTPRYLHGLPVLINSIKMIANITGTKQNITNSIVIKSTLQNGRLK
ncbi:hypothetical protein GCM10023149_35870 [Mucilaginibacter gynuensis]|uniref:Uncharacterized protein n=1 Tax=Mucilaginibacter gynuensis TaxID=1302236 RepID=A0ABP8GVU4_9SPHI